MKLMRWLLASFIVLGLGVSSSYAAYQKNSNEDVGSARVFGGGGFAWMQDKIKDSQFSPDPKIDGWMWAARAGYEYMNANDIFFRAEGFWRGGKVESDEKDFSTFNVDGSAITVNGKFDSYAHNYGANGRIGYMWDFGQEQQFAFAPYTGIGYYGQRASFSEGALTGTGDFLAGQGGQWQARSWYVPVGVYLHYAMGEEFCVGLFAEAQFSFGNYIWEKFQTGTEDDGVTPTYAEATSNGKNEVNWRVELPMTWQLTPRWDLQLSPYYQYSTLTSKDADNLGFGKNTFSDAGAYLELGVSF